MDRNALIRALRDTAQSASNTIASNVSGPVDLIAAGLRGVGLPIPQNAVGGSQWMAEKGLTAPVQQGAAQVIGDTIGLAGPALVANYAPQIASAMNRGVQNLAAGSAPAMRGQMGGVYMGGPRQEALETAQRNAAKPVSEGGLGLPPNNTPMDRARAMGHSDIGVHYTPSDFNEFKIGTRPDNFAAWSTLDPSANMAAHNIGHTGNILEGVQGMPLMARVENRMPLTEKRVIGVSSDFPRSVTELDASKAIRAGYDNARIGSEIAIFEPSRIRSRFAAFDPARINENDLLGRADPRLLGLMGLGAAGGLGAYNYMQGQ